MTSSSLHFKIFNIFLKKNILTCMNFILFIFVIVLTALAYDDKIFAFEGATINKFQNNLIEKIEQNNNSIIINYPNSNITNLTNNNEDSIYGQIAAFENNIYVVWQESVTETLPKHNYDIFFIKSEDKGKTFSNPINLSNNIEYSERPQIAVSKDGIFIVWTDKVSDNNNKQIMFTKSEDKGKTFSKVINLSNNSKNSDNPEISVFNEYVYVIWQESDENNTKSNNNNNKNIIFKRSLDKGNAFNNSIDLIKSTKDAFPKINSYGNNVYVVWNNENKNNSGLFLIKSSDKGSKFEKIIKLSQHKNSGESQIAVNKNEILVVWGGFLSKDIDNIYYAKSNDNGNTFENSKTIFDKTIRMINTNENYNNSDRIIKNPINVEVSNNNLSSIVWQNTFSNENADILLLLSNNQIYNNNTTKLLNLSNNKSFSECPSITIENNNVYIIWEDFILGNHEILFANISL
jgi:hypothetical protein